MRTSKIFLNFSLGLAVMAAPVYVFAQKTAAAPQTLIKRVVVKSEKANFGPGGSITVNGAPKGSITIEGWNKSEVEVTAEIELQAPTEADLALLAKVNTFLFEDTFGRVNILTVGMHDKDYMKKAAKKFPKQLLNLPWKIDYVVHVPALSDLQVTMGKGALKVKGVEGAMQLRAAETDAELEFTGGSVIGTFGAGSVNVRVNTRSWRGRSLQVQLATGNMNVILPPSFNADIDASILRTGEIQNTYAPLKEREKAKFSSKLIAGRTGSGGAVLSFVVGDGIMKIFEEAAAQ
jgi:hypothetical protein